MIVSESLPESGVVRKKFTNISPQFIRYKKILHINSVRQNRINEK